MERESLEELRVRLLGDPRVQQMVAHRAYEIYAMRGHEAGREAEDWFRAESEILAILIEEESRRREDERPTLPRPTPAEPASRRRPRLTTTAKPKSVEDAGKSARRKKAESKSEKPKSKKPRKEGAGGKSPKRRPETET